MKKHILAILVAILCMSLLFAFVACGGGEDPVDPETCDHEWGEWVYNPEPTCTEPGDRARTCTICYKEESEAVPAQHTWGDWSYSTEPTCTTGGRGTRTCDACGASETNDVPANGHVEVIVVPEKLPTITEAGCSKGSKCDVCDEVLEESLTYARLANITGKSEISFKNVTDFWAFKKEALYDGKTNVGTHAQKGKDYSYIFDFKNPAYITDIIIECNGEGTLKAGGNISPIAYNTKAINIVIYTISELGTDGKPVYKMYYETGRVDTSALTQVKISELTGEGVNKFEEPVHASRVELQIFDGTNSGSEYIWEFDIQGSVLETACDVNGHQYGGAVVESEPYCEYDGNVDTLHDGLKKWTCTVCGEEKTETIKAEHSFPDEYEELEPPICGYDGIESRDCVNCGYMDTRPIPMVQDHDWSDWQVVGSITCASGGTRERYCQNSGCNERQEENVAAGTHLNVVTEGAKAPTAEEEGATGKTYCTICKEVISESYVITKLVSVTQGATVTSSVSKEVNWSMAEGLISVMVDGNRETGVCNNWKSLTSMETITLASENGVNKIVIVVNGKGTTNEGNGFDTVTNHDYTISFILYDGNDQVVYTSESYKTADKTEIVVELPETKNVKKMKVIRSNKSYAVEGYIWEVEIYSGGVVTDDVVCEHEMEGWQEIEPAKCGVDGLKRNDCTLCDYFVEEVIPMPTPHSWSEWTNSAGFSCTNGGTRERTCQNTDCGITDTQTVEAGDHIELVTTGAKEPTLDEAGSTGTTTCTACGETVSEATEIPKLVNIAPSATPSTNSTAWQIVGNGDWAKDSVPNINDGNLSTGATTGDDSIRDTVFTLTWETAVNLDKVIVVCNGTGNVGPAVGNVENTNESCDYTITAYDASGNVLKTITLNSLDKTQLELDLSDISTDVKKVDVSLNNLWQNKNGHVFEIIAVEKAN